MVLNCNESCLTGDESGLEVTVVLLEMRVVLTGNESGLTGGERDESGSDWE